MPSTIIQQRAPSATRTAAASHGTTAILENVKGFQKLLHTFRLKLFGNCYSTYVCTTTLHIEDFTRARVNESFC